MCAIPKGRDAVAPENLGAIPPQRLAARWETAAARATRGSTRLVA